MRAEFGACLRRRDIAPFKAAPNLVPKELDQADHDFQAVRRVATPANTSGLRSKPTMPCFTLLERPLR